MICACNDANNFGKFLRVPTPQMHLWCVAMFNVPGFWWCVQFQLVATCHLFPSLQAERELTAGDGWFNLPATPITSELRNDLKVLRMRSAIDPQCNDMFTSAVCSAAVRRC